MKKARRFTSMAPLLRPLLQRVPPATRTAGELLHNWEQYAGPIFAAHTRPAFFDKKEARLTVYCDSPEWNTALAQNSSALIEKIPTRFGVEQLKTVFKKNWRVPPKATPLPPKILPDPPSQNLMNIFSKVQKHPLSTELSKATADYLVLCEKIRMIHG